MKIKSVILSVFLILISANVSAGQVEIGQWMPWSFLSSEIKKLSLNFQSSPTNWTLSWQEWSPQALGSEIQVHGGFSDIQISEQGILAQAQSLSALLKIQQLVIDQTILREVNGNQIQIRVQIQCQPIEIQISSFSASVSAPFQKQNDHWVPRLNALNLEIPPGSWKVSPISCQGPQGVDQTLLTLITENLQNPKSLQEILKSWLAPKIDEAWKTNWEMLLSESWQSLRIKSMTEPGSQGFFLLGQIETANSLQVSLPSLQNAQPDAKVPQLVLSSEGFAALAHDNLKNLSFQNYDLQQIESFRKLMQSRFMQLFVWPDLLHFSRKTPFYLTSNPDQTQMTLKPVSAGNWQLQMQTQGVIRAERKGAMRNYLNWGLGMSANLQTEVKDSRLLLKTVNSQTRLSSSFDSEYVRLFQPSTRMSSGVVEKASKSLFENRSFETALPVLKWKGQELKLNGWKQDGALIWLNWN